MPRMARDNSQPTLTDWDEEKAKQDEIAAQINDAAPVQSTPLVAGTPSDEETTTDEVIVEVPLVTLRPKADVELDYPIAVSVVGAEDGYLIFDGPEDTVDVPAPVAEQITYSPAVEVAA
jgi:hypothetical protein